MLSRNVIILTGLLALGAAMVLIFENSSSRRQDQKVGEHLIPSSLLASIDKIQIKKDAQTLTLIRGDDQVWSMGDGEQKFPVDADFLLIVLDRIEKAKYQSILSERKEQMQEYGLGAGVELNIFVKDKNILALNLGSARPTGEGQYANIVDETKVYLLPDMLQAPLDRDQWEAKTLLSLSPDAIKEIIFTPEPAQSSKSPVTLSRATKEEKFKIQNLANGQKESDAAQRPQDRLAKIRFIKHYDLTNAEAKSALSTVSKVRITTFDAKNYDVEVGNVGEKTKKYFVKIKGPNPTLTSLMERFYFEIDEPTATALSRSLSDFLAEMPKG